MSSTEPKDNPYVAIVTRKQRNLKKKLEKIVKIGESLSSGKTLDEEQLVLYSSKGSVEKLLADISALKDQMEELSVQEAQQKSGDSDTKVESTTGTQVIEQVSAATQAEVAQSTVSTTTSSSSSSSNPEAVALILEASVHKLLKVFHVCLKYKDVTGRSLPSNVDFFGKTLAGQTSIAPFEEALSGSLRCAGVYLSDELAGQSEAVRGFSYSQIAEFINQLALEMSPKPAAAASVAPAASPVDAVVESSVAAVVDAAIAEPTGEMGETAAATEGPAVKEKQKRTRRGKAAATAAPEDKPAATEPVAAAPATGTTVLSEKEVEVKYNTRFQKKAGSKETAAGAPSSAAPAAAPVPESSGPTPAAPPAAAPKAAWNSSPSKAAIDPHPFKVSPAAPPSAGSPPASKKVVSPVKSAAAKPSPSTAFDENLYTKPIDYSTVTKEQMERADKLAREIERENRAREDHEESREEGNEKRNTNKNSNNINKNNNGSASNNSAAARKPKSVSRDEGPANKSSEPRSSGARPAPAAPRASEDSDSHLAAILAANRPSGGHSKSGPPATRPAAADSSKKEPFVKKTEVAAAPRTRPEDRPARSATAPTAAAPSSSSAPRPSGSSDPRPKAVRPEGGASAAPRPASGPPKTAAPSSQAPRPAQAPKPAAAQAGAKPSGAPRPAAAPKPAVASK